MRTLVLAAAVVRGPVRYQHVPDQGAVIAPMIGSLSRTSAISVRKT